MTRVAIVIGKYPEREMKRRVDAILAFNSDGLEVDIIEVEATPYTPGFSGEDAKGAVQDFVAAFRRAEEEGYDAVSPLGILDIAVEEGRQAVSIPVIGALAASLLMAQMMGGRLGLIAYSKNLLPGIQAIAERYGAARSVVAYDCIGIDLTQFAEHEHEIKDRFCVVGRRLIAEQRADVIVCTGISICPVHVDRRELEAVLGVPVVEAIGAPIQLGAALARLGLSRGRS